MNMHPVFTLRVMSNLIEEVAQYHQGVRDYQHQHDVWVSNNRDISNAPAELRPTMVRLLGHEPQPPVMPKAQRLEAVLELVKLAKWIGKLAAQAPEWVPHHVLMNDLWDAHQATPEFEQVLAQEFTALRVASVTNAANRLLDTHNLRPVLGVPHCDDLDDVIDVVRRAAAALDVAFTEPSNGLNAYASRSDLNALAAQLLQLIEPGALECPEVDIDATPISEAVRTIASQMGCGIPNGTPWQNLRTLMANGTTK